MRKLSLEENKQYQLGILKDVAKFCDENGLRYYLAYGTLIGAVRHKGFIPWDDDIDIQMPRPDYDTFVSTYKSDRYRVIAPCTEESRHSFAKIIDTRTIKREIGVKYKPGKELGIDIDVFPMDGQPEDKKQFEEYYEKKHKLLKKFHYTICDFKQYSIKAKLLFLVPYIYANLITGKAIMKRIQKLNNQFKYDESKYVGATDALYNSINNRNPREWYSDTVCLDFEDCKFKAPVGYDEILKQMYGDYMKLPPKDKQVTHHSNEVFLKD